MLNVIFFINRYLPFVDTALGLAQSFILPRSSLQSTCRTILYTHTLLVILGVNAADCILVLRTNAIWNRNQRVALGLFITMFGTFASEIFFTALFLRSFNFTEGPSPSEFPGCLPDSFDPTPGQIGYAILLAFETVIFVATLFKLIYRKFGNYGKPSIFLETLLRDGISSYAMMFGISLINIIIIRAENNSMGLIFVLFHRVLHSILATRLVLRIRRAASQKALGDVEVTEMNELLASGGRNRVREGISETAL